MPSAVGTQLFLSDDRVAERFGVHRTTIWRWVRDGDFPQPIKLSPGCTRWSLDRILEWEEKRQGRIDPEAV